MPEYLSALTNHSAPAAGMELDRVFKALADPTRRAVLERLSGGVAAVSELAEPFDMAALISPAHERARGIGPGPFIEERPRSDRARACLWLEEKEGNEMSMDPKRSSPSADSCGPTRSRAAFARAAVQPTSAFVSRRPSRSKRRGRGPGTPPRSCTATRRAATNTSRWVSSTAGARASSSSSRTKDAAALSSVAAPGGLGARPRHSLD